MDRTGATGTERTERRRGRTVIELERRDDGVWTTTQVDVDTVGTGETAARAAMAYCRKIADGQRETG
jgi:hypothetical protein